MSRRERRTYAERENAEEAPFKPIPRFSSEAEEREFWATHDNTDYVDWSRATRAIFPNLRPSTETISIRLPAPLLADLKALANERDVPYQSLLKVLLAKRVRLEQEGAAQKHRPGLQGTTARRRQR